MKKIFIAVTCIMALALFACERVEKGMEGKKRAQEVKEQAEKAQKQMQQTEKAIMGTDEKKAEDAEKK